MTRGGGRESPVRPAWAAFQLEVASLLFVCFSALLTIACVA